MLTLLILFLLNAASHATPTIKRQSPSAQAPTVDTNDDLTARVTFGGPENPVQVIGNVIPQLGLNQYFNIPFAKAPVGDLRFAPPEKPVYDDIINATSYGPACVQSTPDYAAAFGDLVGPYGMSEDCLQLNVFVPRDIVSIGTGLPVLFFVHGGGFFGGSANSVDGSLLLSAAKEINLPFVYVSVQYRVGILGFPLQDQFAQQGLTNLGLRDVKLALEWVQENIRNFGGDPTKVTIGGQSAGAALTGLTHLWPDYNLFRSSIMMSGTASLTIQNSTGLVDTVAAPAWDALSDSVGCLDADDLVACLRATDVEDLSSAQNNLSNAFSPYALYAPTVDGLYVPKSPFSLLAEGAIREVPFVIGNTKDEGTAFAPRDLASEAEFRAYVQRQQLPPASNTTVDTVVELYPDDPTLGAPFGTGNETFSFPQEWKRTAAFVTDRLFTAPRRHFASSMTANGQGGWSYRWDEVDVPNIPPELGAFHGSDIFFLSGLPFLPDSNFTKAQQDLASSFITYIANFVHFSDPNGPTASMNVSVRPLGNYTPAWPAYESGQILSLSSDEIVQITDDYRKEQVDFLNSNLDLVNGY